MVQGSCLMVHGSRLMAHGSRLVAQGPWPMAKEKNFGATRPRLGPCFDFASIVAMSHESWCAMKHEPSAMSHGPLNINTHELINQSFMHSIRKDSARFSWLPLAFFLWLRYLRERKNLRGTWNDAHRKAIEIRLMNSSASVDLRR